MTPPRKLLGHFHLKLLILVQIQLYFNRNVRQFTATTTAVTCIHVLLAADGGSVEPVEPPLATGLVTHKCCRITVHCRQACSVRNDKRPAEVSR